MEHKDREPHLIFPLRSIDFVFKIFSFKERYGVGSKTGWILRPSKRKEKKKEGRNKNSCLGLVTPTVNILAGARLYTASVHPGESTCERKLNQNIVLFLSH